MPLAPETFYKTPDESILYGASMAGQLAIGETLSSIVEVTVDPDDGDAPLAISATAINGASVQFRAADGEDGTTYYVTVEVLTSLGNELELTCTLVVEVEPALWASRGELERMFGADNVSQWADMDNDQDADEITAAIDAALRDATEDARARLVQAPCDEVAADASYQAPRVLRRAVTQLAGWMLYSARGVADTSSEDGTTRMSVHRKQAEMFFRRVQAGQLLLSSAVGAVPSALSQVEADVISDVETWGWLPEDDD